ncbi:MAG: hypothetical protein ABI881_01015 [Betaproteobacteria bacterium]
MAPLLGLSLCAFADGIIHPTHTDTSLFALGLYFTYIIAGVFGVPAILLFQLFKLRRWWQFALGGFLLGPCAMLIIPFDPRMRPSLYMDLEQFEACAGLGLMCALIFWVVAVYRPSETYAA